MVRTKTFSEVGLGVASQNRKPSAGQKYNGICEWVQWRESLLELTVRF